MSLPVSFLSHRENPYTEWPCAPQVAAGEVVKELLENSLDAGASQIKLSIREGGRTYISGKDCNRPLAEPRILFSGRGQINEEPQCTKVHEDSEFIFDEPRKQKTMVSQEV